MAVPTSQPTIITHHFTPMQAPLPPLGSRQCSAGAGSRQVHIWGHLLIIYHHFTYRHIIYRHIIYRHIIYRHIISLRHECAGTRCSRCKRASLASTTKSRRGSPLIKGRSSRWHHAIKAVYNRCFCDIIAGQACAQPPCRVAAGRQGQDRKASRQGAPRAIALPAEVKSNAARVSHASQAKSSKLCS